MRTKKWYHSKTIWINLIVITAIVIHASVDEELSTAILAAEGSILGVINLILRIITNQGLEK